MQNGAVCELSYLVKIAHNATMAGLHTFYWQLNAKPGETVGLAPEESRHIVKSLRGRPGEGIDILNGQGMIFRGKLKDADARNATVLVEEIIRIPRRTPLLVLAQSLLKGKALDDMLRDVITLGLGRLMPLCAARCEVHLDTERTVSRVQRWRTAAVEACKQSGNPWLPEIEAPCVPAQLSERLSLLYPDAPVWKFIGSLEADAQPLAEVLQASKKEGTTPAAMVLAIGPEGDFTPEEYAQCRAQGFRPVQLPGYIFRAGPAALVGLSLLAANTFPKVP